IAGTKEIPGPLTAGTIATLLVFGPIIFVRGLAAALFRDLSLSVVMSVGASLILALTLMPVMVIGRRRAAGSGQRATPADSRVTRHASRRTDPLARLGHAFERLYERGMKWSLANPVPVFALTVIAVIGTAWGAVRPSRATL